MNRADTRSGFTLIELLVVVTIIAVLLAILTPALDKAIYQAELVQCSSKLKATGAAVLAYTFESKRYYPDRKLDGQNPNSTGNSMMINPMALSRPERLFDFRPMMAQVLDINKYLQCPFTKQLDLLSHDATDADVNVEASYLMFWGWRYRTKDQTKVQAKQDEKVKQIAGNNSDRGMFKYGDRFTSDGDPYNVLGGDIDLVYQDSTQSSHPDREPTLMFLVSAQNEVIIGLRGTVSRWLYRGGASNDAVQNQLDDAAGTAPSGNVRARGLLDQNFVYDDGSVRRLPGVLNWNRGPNRRDERMDWIPLQFDSQRPGDQLQIPRR